MTFCVQTHCHLHYTATDKGSDVLRHGSNTLPFTLAHCYKLRQVLCSNPLPFTLATAISSERFCVQTHCHLHLHTAISSRTFCVQTHCYLHYTATSAMRFCTVFKHTTLLHTNTLHCYIQTLYTATYKLHCYKHTTLLVLHTNATLRLCPSNDGVITAALTLAVAPVGPDWASEASTEAQARE